MSNGNSHEVSVQFLGGAETVTGSKYLVRSSKQSILIDCGLYQGLKELRLRNWAPLPVKPNAIDAVIITHAHLDHTGYLPLLVRNGFRGKIYCTDPTWDLTKIILVDSAKIQEADAEYANRKKYSKHEHALPLYATADVDRVFELVNVVPLNKWVKLGDGSAFRLIPSGHILGSAFIELNINDKRLVFSGDLGRQRPILLKPPSFIDAADYLVLESTYGDRVHDSVPPLDALCKVIQDTVSRMGHLLIASFAVGRAQDLTYLISKLKIEKRIPNIPVYLDSPMAVDATDILCTHAGWHALSRSEIDSMCASVTIVRTREESKRLLDQTESSIVIASSGMLSGGRILYHLERRLSDPKNTVLLVGFQAAGTRGRLLKDGIQELKMHGHYIPVRAKIVELTTLSSHADQSEILSWLGHFHKAPKKTFLIHGEPQASDALRVKIKDVLGWDTQIPKYLDVVNL